MWLTSLTPPPAPSFMLSRQQESLHAWLFSIPNISHFLARFSIHIHPPLPFPFRLTSSLCFNILYLFYISWLFISLPFSFPYSLSPLVFFKFSKTSFINIHVSPFFLPLHFLHLHFINGGKRMATQILYVHTLLPLYLYFCSSLLERPLPNSACPGSYLSFKV